MNQLAIVLGILVSYLVGWELAGLGEDSWRWMFAVAALPALFLLVAMFFVPESPRWLMEKGREQEARKVLERAAGTVAVDRRRHIVDVFRRRRQPLRPLQAPSPRRPPPRNSRPW